MAPSARPLNEVVPGQFGLNDIGDPHRSVRECSIHRQCVEVAESADVTCALPADRDVVVAVDRKFPDQTIDNNFSSESQATQILGYSREGLCPRLRWREAGILAGIGVVGEQRNTPGQAFHVPQWRK